MLIQFTVENWKSFRAPACLNMVAGRQTTHKHRLMSVRGDGFRLLPIAAIYGANASGKSNLFQAIDFARNFVVNGSGGSQAIPVEPFLLDAESASHPTSMRFDIRCGSQVYAYSFAVTSDRVVSEELVEVRSTSERFLYRREAGRIQFDRHLPDQERLNFVYEGTSENQLFLNNATSQKVETFKPISEWFQRTLRLISPESRFSALDTYMNPLHPSHGVLNAALHQLDTGIGETIGVELPLDSIALSDSMRRALMAQLHDGAATPLPTGDRERLVVRREGAALRAFTLGTRHSDGAGNSVLFDFSNESDGTRRLLDVLPAFHELCTHEADNVFVVDELDRSMHSLLVYRLLAEYLESCTEHGRSQLIFTSHDLHLMDQDLLRRDELWATERDETGNTSLCSFDEFKGIRTDKDIRRLYTQGSIGGVPHISLFGTLSGRAAAGTGVET